MAHRTTGKSKSENRWTDLFKNADPSVRGQLWPENKKIAESSKKSSYEKIKKYRVAILLKIREVKTPRTEKVDS